MRWPRSTVSNSRIMIRGSKTACAIKCPQATPLASNSTGPEVIKLFSCSAQLRLKFILLINVKILKFILLINVKMPTMPTIVSILTLISRINYCLIGSMPEFSTDLGYFSTYELLKIHAQMS